MLLNQQHSPVISYLGLNHRDVELWAQIVCAAGSSAVVGTGINGDGVLPGGKCESNKATANAEEIDHVRAGGISPGAAIIAIPVISTPVTRSILPDAELQVEVGISLDNLRLSHSFI